MSRWLRWLQRISPLYVAALVAAGLALAVWSLLRYPPIHCDEAYYGSAAVNALANGSFGSPASGDAYGMAQNFVIMGRFYLLSLGVWYRLFGIAQAWARAFSLLGWLLAAGGTYMVGRRAFGHWVGVVAALLFAYSWRVFPAAHLARPEIWLTAWLVWGTWLWLRLPPRVGFGYALGLYWALGMEWHFNALLFVLAFGVLTGWQAWQQQQWRWLLACWAGVGSGCLLWLAWHFLPDWQLAWLQWQGYTRLGMGVGAKGLPQLLLEFWAWLLENFWRGNRGLDAVEGLLFLAGVLWAAAQWRPRQATPRSLLLGLLLLSLTAFAVLLAQRLLWYRVLWVPYLALLAAAALAAGFRRVPIVAALPQGLAYALLPVFALLLVGNYWLARTFSDGRYSETAAALRQLIPAQARVLGDPIWWFAFDPQRNQYISDFYLAVAASQLAEPAVIAQPVQHHLTFSQIASILEANQIDYVIQDDYLHCLVTTEYQPYDALTDYLQQACTLQGTVAGGWYGEAWATLYPLGEQSRVYACP